MPAGPTAKMAVLRCLLFDKEGKTSERRCTSPVAQPEKSCVSLVIFRSRGNRTAPRYQLPQFAALRESEPSDRKRAAYPCARLGNGRGCCHRKDNVGARITH